MGTPVQKTAAPLPLPQLRQTVQPSIADQVFKVLHDRILSRILGQIEQIKAETHNWVTDLSR